MNSKLLRLKGLIAGVSFPLLLHSFVLSAQAIQLTDGSVQFDHPPTLQATSAAQSRSGSGMYYLTLSLPSNAGEALTAVIIAPQDLSNPERKLQFELDQTEAFLGTPQQPGTQLGLQQVELLESSADIRVTFMQPIRPGTTVTIGLKPSHTPNRHRIYQFGVTAIPAAEIPSAVFLGYGQVNFQGDRYRDYPFWWNRDDIFPYYNETDHRVLFWDLPPEFDIRTRRHRANP